MSTSTRILTAPRGHGRRTPVPARGPALLLGLLAVLAALAVLALLAMPDIGLATARFL